MISRYTTNGCVWFVVYLGGESGIEYRHEGKLFHLLFIYLGIIWIFITLHFALWLIFLHHSSASVKDNPDRVNVLSFPLWHSFSGSSEKWHQTHLHSCCTKWKNDPILHGRDLPGRTDRHLGLSPQVSTCWLASQVTRNPSVLTTFHPADLSSAAGKLWTEHVPSLLS